MFQINQHNNDFTVRTVKKYNYVIQYNNYYNEQNYLIK